MINALPKLTTFIVYATLYIILK